MAETKNKFWILVGKLKPNFKGRFWTSFSNISWLLVFTFLPLGINLLVALIPAIDKAKAIESKIVPGEMLAYCLSLIAPLFLFLLKTHGKSFGLPALKPVFIISFIIYLLALTLTLIAKNGLIDGIDLKAGHTDTYLWISVYSLLIAIALRFYTDYQDSRYSDYKLTLDKQQQDFNKSFSNSIGQV